MLELQNVTNEYPAVWDVKSYVKNFTFPLLTILLPLS